MVGFPISNRFSVLYKERDDSRYKMIESDVVSALLTRSKNQNSCVCQTTAKAVAELAKYGRYSCL